MIYLSGAVHADLVDIPGLGFMLTPHMGNRPDLRKVFWAADTGCFRHPEAFDSTRYFTWLAKFPQSTCCFATAPDRFADWRMTIELAMPVLHELRARGFRAALVAQDGLTAPNTPWEACDALFLGGTTQWKEGAEAHVLAKEATAHGKWLHMGRVNSLRRMQLARDWGCNSVDGTYLAFGRNTNRRNVERWLKWTNEQRQFCF